MSEKPVVLIILDGWGINMQKEGNAIACSKGAGLYRSC